MTENATTDDTQTGYILTSAVYFVRALQATAALFSVVLVGGAIAGDFHVLAFLMVAVFVGLLLLVILVLEFVAVRGLRRWADG